MWSITCTTMNYSTPLFICKFRYPSERIDPNLRKRLYFTNTNNFLLSSTNVKSYISHKHSWIADSCLASQEKRPVLRNPKFYCRMHKRPSLHLFRSQTNLGQTVTRLTSLRAIMIPYYRLHIRMSSDFFPPFSYSYFVSIFLLPHAWCHFYIVLLDYISLIIFRKVQIMKL